MSRKIKKKKADKRSKKSRNNDIAKKIARMNAAFVNSFDKKVIEYSEKIREIYLKYNADDVAVALNISDLWLPNISSQIKHHFAFGIFLEIDFYDFNQTERIDNYSKFCDFIDSVHELIPSFPMLEDYVPEQDWGEIKISSCDRFRRIFYGSLVERIPDFIDAFRIINTNNVDALCDMDAAVLLQDIVIAGIDSEVVGRTDQIYPGFIEAPSEEFWLQAKVAIELVHAKLQDLKTVSNELIVELGNFQQDRKFESFSNSVMRGLSIPFLMINVNNTLYPISLRNSTSVILDFWANTSEDMDPHKFAANLSTYLSLRIDNEGLIGGPLNIATKKNRLPYTFSAIIKSDQKFQFIISVPVEYAPHIEGMVKDVTGVISGEEEWAFFSDHTEEYIQIRNRDDSTLYARDIELVIVLVRAATASIPIYLPKTSARLISLSDFLTISDSIEHEGEWNQFWSYFDRYRSVMNQTFVGMADIFASFRDSHSVLIDGAVNPNMISLDPHWGSNWRFNLLADFWRDAPPSFPDDNPTWVIDSKHGETWCLTAKGKPILAWTTVVNNCVVHVAFTLIRDMSSVDGQMLELFVHCLIDALSQAKNSVIDLSIFQRERIVILCEPFPDGLAKVAEEEFSTEDISKPLFNEWQLHSNLKSLNLFASVKINLARVQSGLDTAVDASFEVECVIALLSELLKLNELEIDHQIVRSLEAANSKRPRFTLKRGFRQFDVPDYSDPKVPSSAQYKAARRDLAVLIKEQGVEPGRYELNDAKLIIDIAKNNLRDKIHLQVERFKANELISFCIQQHDSLSAEYSKTTLRVKQSLEHDVSYDRSRALSEAHEKFTTSARNYRYLIELSTTLASKSQDIASVENVIQLVASIDWLFVLYGASDVLHNDIDVVGLDLDDSFVPSVFYSDQRITRENEFSLEMASLKLGLDLLQNDEVTSDEDVSQNWKELDVEFVKDVGFSITHLLQFFRVLSQWFAHGKDTHLKLSYQTSEAELLDGLLASIEDLTEVEAKLLINFAVLDPTKIRCLLGRAVVETDVPVWEHNKRDHRYNIRPLIRLDNDSIIWGAAASYKAGLIWSGALANGYLPSDFEWPNVKRKVREIKSKIERDLENRAVEVCSRYTTYLHHGIDFKLKFPKYGFDDVGDFDVLAYWPEKNYWLCIECKYNQPPFCLKDSRRLRERIFGTDSNHGQFSKIEKRREFLASNLDQLCLLMKWPLPSAQIPATIDELYVSREIYWWLRNPPYEVPTSFVRIDGLDYWLRNRSVCDITLVERK